MPTIRSHWQYINNDCPPLLDPRVLIVQQLNWQIFGAVTPWLGVEPDNYNFAIFDNKPYDIKFIKDQCWYKIDQTFRKRRIQGWMSVYVITDREQTIAFNQELIKIQPQAVWRYDKAKPIRSKRPLMDRENIYKRRSDTNFSTEERLWQMGYYEKLKSKYLDDEERFFKVVGIPREAVLNPYYLEDSEGETDYCDN